MKKILYILPAVVLVAVTAARFSDTYGVLGSFEGAVQPKAEASSLYADSIDRSGAPAVLSPVAGSGAAQKKIVVTLDDQTLRYFEGYNMIAEFKIASGVKGLETPPGEYHILRKLPENLYEGADYYYPDTKWNLEFLEHSGGNYYIHGAPWNHHLGRPGSHGCINVAYSDMEPLYNWADVGTEVLVQK